MERSVIIGLVLSVLGAGALFLGGVLDIVKHSAVVKQMDLVGFPLETVRAFGVIKVLIAILILIQATAFFGVVLATGWMGGAIAAHVRVKDQYAIQVILPIVIWVGFGLRHQSAMHTLLGF